MKPELLAQTLFKEFKIFTVAIDYANVQRFRITPKVFTTIAELDYFIKAIKTLSNAQQIIIKPFKIIPFLYS